MASFDFSAKVKTNSTAFNGPLFYQTYKDSQLLRVDANVEAILCHGYLMRQEVNSYPPGHSVVIKGVNLEKNTPLIVKRGGKGVIIGDLEFTYNRLVSLVAAYAFENRARFPAIEASDAKALGLVWDNNDELKSRLYLSALSGTENMIDQFSFYPLICGLRKCQLKKMPANLVASMGYVKNSDGETMGQVMKKKFKHAIKVWLKFPGATPEELTAIIIGTPEFKRFLY